MAGTMAAASSYKELILFLTTAGVAVPLFQQLRISPVLGFIGVGALIGPYGLGRLTDTVPWLSQVTISNREEFAHLAEFGVVFLLFTIGLELSWERLRAMRRLVFGFGGLQVVACSAALAMVATLLGMGPRAAILIGIALALSSTAIVIPLLAARKRLGSPTGRTSFAILLFQDLAVAPVLFTITALADIQPGNLAGNLTTALGQAAIAVGALVLAGRLALRPMFQLVAESRSPELFMAACLLVIVATALVAAMSGLSMALGAFVAGLLLAETEYRRAVEATIEPFKGLLLGVFFVSVGMGLDVSRLAERPILILACAAGLILIKSAIIYGLGAIFRMPARIGLETGLLLGAGGEFAFVLIGAATAAGMVPSHIGQDVLVLTTVSMVALPMVARLAAGLGSKLENASAQPLNLPQQPPESRGRVVIAGYGRVGQLIGDMLNRHGIDFVALDTAPALVAAEHEKGKPVYFGDSASSEVLRVCGIDTARALVVTLDSPKAVEGVVIAARERRPDLIIVARARDARHASALYKLGVNDAVPETIEASLQLSEAVLVDIGIAMGPVIASIHERRDEFRKILRESSAGNGHEHASEFYGRRGVSSPEPAQKPPSPAAT